MATSKKTSSEDAVDSVSLHEFCIRLSEKEKRVELIAGFEADERINGRKKDSSNAFAARFQAFVTRPA